MIWSFSLTMWSSRRCLPAPLAGSLSSSSRPATRGCSSGCRSVYWITYFGHWSHLVTQEPKADKDEELCKKVCIASLRKDFKTRKYVAGERELEQPSSSWQCSRWRRLRCWTARWITSRYFSCIFLTWSACLTFPSFPICTTHLPTPDLPPCCNLGYWQEAFPDPRFYK